MGLVRIKSAIDIYSFAIGKAKKVPTVRIEPSLASPIDDRSRQGWLGILLGTPFGKGCNNLVIVYKRLHNFSLSKVVFYTFLLGFFGLFCNFSKCKVAYFAVSTCSGVPAWKNLGLHASTPTCKVKGFSLEMLKESFEHFFPQRFTT